MIKAKAFDLKQVRLLDGPFKEAMLRDQKYLLQLEPDRFLHSFRVNAGLPSDAVPYGGWEALDCELRGHSIGHYLSACAMMFASTDDEQFRARVTAVVSGLAKCQDKSPDQGYHAGFLSAYPESFFDRLERREPVWAPYYTLHKILAGLLDAYIHCGNQQALEILERLVDWIQFRISRLSHEGLQITLLNEFGGVNETLANLYAVTGKPEHLRLSLAFDDDVVFDPLAHGEDRLDRMHANTQIPKAIGAARQYEVSGETRLRDVAQFFWERVALARSYAIGGHSDDELFFPIDRFAEHLSPVTAETCNTHNTLKLTRHLFSWEPSARTMDFYERGLFNQILGSQDPQTGMMIYFASLKPGHFKVYNTPEHSFWCCTGTGMENHAKYGDTIYYHDDKTLYVNLFIASELHWEEKGLSVRQETRFPEQDAVQITLNCQMPTRLAIKIRYPAWAADFQLRINGKADVVQANAGSYVTIEREWNDGDLIELRMPMTLHVKALPAAPNIIAIMYGPIVLAGTLGTENMPDVYLRDMYTRITEVNNWSAPPTPVLVGAPSEVISNIVPVEGKPLTFQTKGIGSPHDVEMIPFYRVHHERYTVYWQLEAAPQKTP